MVYFVEPDFTRIYHNSSNATHQGGLVLRYGLEKGRQLPDLDI